MNRDPLRERDLERVLDDLGCWPMRDPEVAVDGDEIRLTMKASDFDRVIDAMRKLQLKAEVW